MLKLITAPTEEPLSLVEVRAHLRLDPPFGSQEDALLTGLITTTRMDAETRTRRALITQTWDLYLDRFPLWVLELPLPPLQSVSSITYIDSQGATQVLSASKYKVDTASSPGRVTPAFGEVWPDTREEMNAVTVRFVAGYGAAGAVPEGIKAWMKMRVTSLYEQREQFSQGQPVEALPHTFLDGLLDPYRVMTF